MSCSLLLGSNFHISLRLAVISPEHIKCLSPILVVYVVLHKPFVVLIK